MDETIKIREMVKETVWAGGSDARMPDMVITHEGVFCADGVTPMDLTDADYVSAGYKRMSRWVSPWEEEEEE